MTVMKISEIRTFSSDEIAGKLFEGKDNLRKLRFAHAISPIENPIRIRIARRDIARLKTIQKERILKGD